MLKELVIEISEGVMTKGKQIDWVFANKVANLNCKGLIYLGNVMDISSKENTVYVWLRDDEINEYYFIKL